MNIYIFLTFFFGAAFTYSAASHLGAIVAASLAGLLGSFLARKELQASVYSGAFAGMSSSFIVSDIYELALVSLAGGGMLVLVENKFVGYGGKLGASAFLSVCSLVLLKGLIWS